MPKFKYYNQTTDSWLTIDSENASFLKDVNGTVSPQDIREISDDIGDVTTLTTTAKKVVAAINEINAKPTGGDTTEIAKQINTLYKLSTGIIREQAYTKLLQDASERLDGGTVFAHDMNGNIIGMTLDEANSQSIVIRNGKMLMLGKGEITKTVTDATVVASAYDTSGNGGRKLVRLSNGKFIIALKNVSGNTVVIYSSIDGTNWTGIKTLTGMTVLTDVAMVPYGNRFAVIIAFNNDRILYYSYEENGTQISTSLVDSSQTAMGNVSLTINPEGTELHAAWSSKSPTFPNAFNLRYAKGVISQIDGSVTWGTVEQATTYGNADANIKNPSIGVNGNGKPFILADYLSGTTYYIVCVYFTTIWQTAYIYNGGIYAQSSPSAIFVPKSVNGLANGRIWVAWSGMDATDSTYDNVRVSYSDDGGVTWSAMQKLTSGNVNLHAYPSISADKNNRIYIIVDSYINTTSSRNVGVLIFNGSWSSVTMLTSKAGSANVYPSSIHDNTFTLDFTSPLFIYKNVPSTKVGFYGTWQQEVEIPSLTAKAVYDIPSTDFVGAFVKKIGATTVQAYVNDTLMDAELVDSEYQFVKQLDLEAPVKLRLDLSRANVSGGESDAVTRVLGGRS